MRRVYFRTFLPEDQEGKSAHFSAICLHSPLFAKTVVSSFFTATLFAEVDDLRYDALAANGEGLGTMWGEERACQMLSAAGFTQLEVKHIEADVINSYYIASRD